MELQAGNITTSKRGVPATTPTSSPSHIADEVLALVNGVSKIAEAIFDVQSTVDPTSVRTPASIMTTFTHYLTR